MAASSVLTTRRPSTYPSRYAAGPRSLRLRLRSSATRCVGVVRVRTAAIVNIPYAAIPVKYLAKP
jgi:hypothetical protein